jgi:SET domain-containing protein
VVADIREVRHREAGLDDYQFRLGDSVVDATEAGGMARYINHSCSPNCVVTQCSVDGQLHLGIFSGRHIEKGEELCYDYKVCYM